MFGITLAPMDVDDPRDAAIFALKNRLKTIMVNSRQVQPLWWEALLIPKGSIEHCPMAAIVPDKWVAKLQPSREFCADIVRDCTTLGDVIKKVTKSAPTLIAMDRNFECDIVYLTHHATDALNRLAHQLILNTSPTDGASADFSQTLVRIKKARSSDLLVACGEAFSTEVDGIYDLLQHISAGQPPPGQGHSEVLGVDEGGVAESVLVLQV